MANNLIMVRSGKGDKDRALMMPLAIREPLVQELAHVKKIHEKDLVIGYGEVSLPHALDKKYPKPPHTQARGIRVPSF